MSPAVECVNRIPSWVQLGIFIFNGIACRKKTFPSSQLDSYSLLDVCTPPIRHLHFIFDLLGVRSVYPFLYLCLVSDISADHGTLQAFVDPL